MIQENITLKYVTDDLVYGKSTLTQVMAWYR